ncbi:MAG: hypothetical protein HYW25_01405 [Candidatus Aenigmarchaeota archaeon]|nr:hypothetical protein [Candidatus Aenigmarchaeota archaeon]
MAYKSILESVRVEVPVKTYATPHATTGEMPPWLSERLPLFASEDGDMNCYNSGGRGILTEENGEVYRIKGADPKGVITRTVSASEKNIIRDVDHSAESVPDAQAVERLLHSKLLCVPFPGYRDGRPWNFLTRENIRNSRRAFEILGEAYSKLGLASPCRFAGAIEYPFLTWQNEPLYSEVLQLPDIESDLRQDEFEVLMRRHLQHASPEELREIKECICRLYESLLQWHAFECRALADSRLVMHPDSFLGQNHVIAHVGSGKIAISRVDHTSTVESEDERKIHESARSFASALYNMPLWVAYAVEMAERRLDYDRKRFSGYFDVAFKSSDPIKKSEYPEAVGVLERCCKLFEAALADPHPEPADESLLLSVFERATAVKIDEEFERRRKLVYEEAKRKLASMGISDRDLIRALTRK